MLNQRINRIERQLKETRGKERILYAIRRRKFVYLGFGEPPRLSILELEMSLSAWYKSEEEECLSTG